MLTVIRPRNIISFFIAIAFGLGAVIVSQPTKSPESVFGFDEAVSHLKKRVRSHCNASDVKSEQTTGRTMFVQADEHHVGYLIAIDWDYSIRGKHEILFVAKDVYTKCIEEVGMAEN